jgi:hypothetical protein
MRLFQGMLQGMKAFARFLLPMLLLVGCASNPALTQAEFDKKLQTACTSTDEWLKHPRDPKLLDQAVSDCDIVSKTYADTDFSKSKPMKDLTLMKLALMLCKTALESGAAPDQVPEGLASQSPADSVRQAKEMIEADLHPGTSPSASSSPTPS